MKRPSLRSSTIVSVALIGLSFILLSSLAGNYFREAALNAQTKSLSRIIEIASHEILRKLQQHALNLSTSINAQNNLGKALHSWKKNQQTEEIVAILDDPFITGFVGAHDVELAKVRVYDITLSPVAQSLNGLSELPFQLPPQLHFLASKRQGVDRLKALSTLWIAEKGPLYSILLPVGGLHIEGYLEVVFDPRYSLRAVSQMTRMPVTILLPHEHYSPPEVSGNEASLLPIEYTLVGDDGVAAYRMIGLENINKLNQDMLQTQWFTVIGFLTLIFLILLLSLWLLRIGLFIPLRNLLLGIEAYSQGKLDTTIKAGGLLELYTLGNAFNDMLKRIRDVIQELERHSTLDGLTSIANRRFFDQSLQKELSRAIRRQTPLSLLYIDIDYFKHYNDHYGHLAGDDTLYQAAQLVSSMARRETDVAARLGGEEFAILLPETEPENARLVAENLRLAINHLDIEHLTSEIANHITFSIGVATITPEKETSASTLMDRADKALYQAKSEGRNRVAVYQ